MQALFSDCVLHLHQMSEVIIVKCGCKPTKTCLGYKCALYENLFNLHGCIEDYLLTPINISQYTSRVCSPTLGIFFTIHVVKVQLLESEKVLTRHFHHAKKFGFPNRNFFVGHFGMVYTQKLLQA